MARPRVLFVTASYPTPEAPTSGIFVREHARAAALGADVATVHLHRCERSRAWLRAVPVPGEEVPTWRVDYPRRPLALSYPANLAALAAGWRAVRRSGFRPDLIHAHFFLAGVPAALAGAALRLPVVTTEHWTVFLPSDPMQLGALPLRLARFAFERSALVLPVSRSLGEAIESAGVRARFRIVPNAVDTTVFRPEPRPSEGRGRLLAVSGLHGAKGYEYLLPAVARLRERGIEVTLDVVGDGEGRSAYERLAAELGLGEAVRFHGEQPKDVVARAMREADVFVLASLYENNPCVVLEALASGLPVVATSVGGVPEVVGPERGLLAAPGDVDDLVARIEEMLARSDVDRDAIVRGAVAEFGLDAVGSALAGVYADVLEGRVRR